MDEARALIIHPTDLGPTSEAAFRHALRIGVALKASLRLVHVRQTSRRASAPVDAFPQVRQTLVGWGLLEPGAAPAAVAEQLGLSVTKAEANADDPEAGLEGILAKARPDLVVLGTHGLDGFEALRRNSFAEALIRRARTPALIVPAGAPGFVGEADGAVRLKSVLAPIAAEPYPAPALTAVCQLIEALGSEAELNLLHVGPEDQTPAFSVPHGRPHNLLVRQGAVVEEIVAAAEETQADLIVMATEGHTNLIDALLGSTTEQVLRRARRPLLAVPAG